MTAPAETPTSATQYTHLIYAAALRQTKDPHLAADITQAVFLVLLKKSQRGHPPEEHHMTGWLLQVTHYIIRETRRASFRRHRRERTLPTPAPTPPSNHPELTDLLDTALLSLHPIDRELIARRYLHEEPLDSLAATLSLSPNTTTKRLTRALEKLRTALAHKGVTTPTAVLTATLATQATIKSPTASASTLTTPSPLAKHLAQRFLWHSLILKTTTVASIAAACCLITTITAFLAFHATSPAETAASTPTTPATASQPADEPLIHIDKILEPASDQLLAQTLAGIHDYLSKLKTLQLDATYTIHWPNLVVHGAPADSQTVGTGWIDALTGRFRMEISLRRTPWSKGAAQGFLDESFAEVWDGAKTRVLHGPPYSTARGGLFHESSADDRMLFGTTFSTQLMQDIRILHGDGGYFIHAPFDEHSVAQLRLVASRVIINHHESVELQTHFRLTASIPEARRQRLEKFARTYWFDPSRGYALLAFQDSIDGDHIFEQRAIDELTEAAPGIFYPTRAHFIVYARDPEQWILWCTGEFHATRITANQPLNPTLFHLDFPPGIPISHRGPSASSQPASQP